MEFCYLVRREVIDEPTLDAIREALARFHHYREIFRTTGVRPTGFGTLPRQHSMVHYPYVIEQFAACNGLCTSITENLHIGSVKEPWRRSNKNEPLGQMLLNNQRSSRLAALRTDLKSRGLLEGSCLWDVFRSHNHNEGGPAAVPLGPAAADAHLEVDPASSKDREEDEQLEDDELGEEDGPVHGARIENEVKLARKRRE